jgi:predicted  nucleic acid-binding Zn-ribbon protein
VSSLDDLLTVQTLDTRADQLRHRRDTLPELEELAAVRARRADVDRRSEVVAGRLHEIKAREKALEDEAALVEDKAAEVDRKLYDGSVVAHKELEAFQADHRMLKQRQAQLEDEAIVLLEEAEPVEAELASLHDQPASHQADIDRPEAAVTEARAVIDAELGQVATDRATAAASVPADILAAYEPMRQRLGGIGAARLVGARCEGCHLEIPSAQLEEVRQAPPDALVTCPECGRLLVR